MSSSGVLPTARHYTPIALLVLAWSSQFLGYSQPADALQMVWTGGAVLLGVAALGWLRPPRVGLTAPQAMLLLGAVGMVLGLVADVHAMRPLALASLCGLEDRSLWPMMRLHWALLPWMHVGMWVGGLAAIPLHARDATHLPPAVLRAPGPERRMLGMDDRRDVVRGAHLRISGIAVRRAYAGVDARRHVQRHGLGDGGKRCALSVVLPPASHGRFERQSTRCGLLGNHAIKASAGLAGGCGARPAPVLICALKKQAGRLPPPESQRSPTASAVRPAAASRTYRTRSPARRNC